MRKKQEGKLKSKTEGMIGGDSSSPSLDWRNNKKLKTFHKNKCWEGRTQAGGGKGKDIILSCTCLMPVPFVRSKTNL